MKTTVLGVLLCCCVYVSVTAAAAYDYAGGPVFLGVVPVVHDEQQLVAVDAQASSSSATTTSAVLSSEPSNSVDEKTHNSDAHVEEQHSQPQLTNQEGSKQHNGIFHSLLSSSAGVVHSADQLQKLLSDVEYGY
eukprot:c8109_g2_i2.p1 GENE.c8109_g2_i2~~c8109_g2_i2.p1  ORF type:complete len:134 (+),score=53.17 c8109_g2_i2:178-579(+)